jgi:transcriptional regulator GlxA family with amidase domain
MFSLAGVSWQRFTGHPIAPEFHTQIASPGGKPFLCSNRITLHADCDIAEVTTTNILLIPTIGGDIDTVLQKQQGLLPHLQRLANTRCDMVSNCSGAFLLAKAGLLAQRRATTHWGYAEKFKTMFPDVLLNEKQLITQDAQFYCAGGGLSFQDMCLMLIERYAGRDTANQVAKAHVINRQSGFQETYANFHRYKTHKVNVLIEIQEYIETHYDKRLSVDSLAKDKNLTVRTLHRQFKTHVGVSPVQYIQAVRIENAKRLLEQGLTTVKRLPSLVGYDDLASFTRLFKSYTGHTPASYRAQFATLLPSG